VKVIQPCPAEFKCPDKKPAGFNLTAGQGFISLDFFEAPQIVAE